MDQLSLLGGSSPSTSSRRKSGKPRKPSRDATHCHGCGEPLAPRAVRRGLPMKWCRACKDYRSKGPVTKPCACCGIEMTGPATKRWCSRRCANQKKYRLQVAYWKPPEPTRPRNTHCLSCGEQLPPSRGGGVRKWCSRKCAPRSPRKRLRLWFAGFCIECGESFVTNQPHARYCSDLCCRRRADRHKSQRRIARKLGNGGVEAIDIRQIAERDDWTCHLCRQPVTEATWSLDHLHPLSLGGEHIASNVALAHRLCNAVRGALPLKETQAITSAALAVLKDAA